MSGDQETTTVESGADTLLDKADLFYSETEAETEATDEGTADTEGNTEVEATETETQEDEGEQVHTGPETTKYEFDEDSGLYSFQSNGKTVQADAAKLIDSLQSLDGHQKETEKLVTTRKTLETDYTAKSDDLVKYQKNLEAVAEELQKVFLNEEQAIDWDALRDEDITEYTKQRELQETKRNALKSAIDTAKNQRSEREESVINSELDKLDKVMDWTDNDDKRTADMKSLKGYLKEINLPEAALKGVYDHNVYFALHEAAKYRELKASVEEAKKKVKAAPKSVESKKTASTEEKKSPTEILYGTS